MSYRCASLQLLVIVVAVCLAAQSRGQHPEPIVYNQVTEAPLPGPFVCDFKIFDWDGDGKADLLTTGGDDPWQRIYWHRGIGSQEKLMFENGFENDRILIADKRLGRGFGFIDWNGNGKRDIIAFARQGSVAEIGKKPINLNVFQNQGTVQEPKWQVVPAQSSRGGNFQIGENVWVSATLEVVDWDADGKEDLLISIWHPKVYLPVGSKFDGHLNPLANYHADSAYVYWVRNVSTGDVPVFQPPVRLSAKVKDLKFHCWAYLNVCDFNGDGLHDLLVGEHKPGMHVFLNIGTKGEPDLVYHGLLQDETGKPIESMMSIHPEMGDLDGDGTPELVTSPYFSGTYGFSLYRHDGRSGLERGWKDQGLLPCRTEPSSCIVGQTIAGPDVVDWDSDGDRDLILGSEPGLIFLVENVGSESNRVFDPPRPLKFAGGDLIEIYSVDIGRGSMWGPSEFYFERTAPRVADWDKDGVFDILTGSMGARLVWLKGVKIEGEIRFLPPRIMRMDGGELEVSQRLQPDLLDWNGDGNLDIVAMDEANYACVFLGNGTEELLSMQPFQLVDGKKILTNENYKNIFSGRRSFAMADWDGDGHQDLFIYKSYDGFHYYRGTGKAGVFEKSVNLFPSFQGHNGGVTIVDWDGDGLLDILTGGDARNVMGSDVSPIRRQGFTAKGHLFVIKGQFTALRPTPVPSR